MTSPPRSKRRSRKLTIPCLLLFLVVALSAVACLNEPTDVPQHSIPGITPKVATVAATAPATTATADKATPKPEGTHLAATATVPSATTTPQPEANRVAETAPAKASTPEPESTEEERQGLHTPARPEDSTIAETEEFASISAGDDYTCSVKTNGSLSCWGQNRYGGAMPPTGEFTSVSIGEHHGCGVRTNGSVACWGRDENGQATPPKGSFKSVSAGYGHTCGVRIEGPVSCWGADHIQRGHTANRFFQVRQCRWYPHMRSKE